MQKSKKLSALFLSIVLAISLFGSVAFADDVSPDAAPAQIGVTMTEDPQHSVSVTWTTIDTNLTDPVVTVNGMTFNAVKTVRAVTSSNLTAANGTAVTQKAFYNAILTGLEPGTAYTYVCSAKGADGEVYAGAGGTFRTAPSAGDDFTFMYWADPQASGVNGKAITANSSFLKKYDLSFLYIAGDLTDTAANEGQWETFFNQKAAGYVDSSLVSNNFSNALSDYVIASVQGNHDNGTFANHIAHPNSGGADNTYAYTYGSARFIMLNLETGYIPARAEQQAFLREQAAYAKANGLWTIVGFHKAIYSGASHMNDNDVIDARQYWAPLFAELDVDVVLQGHDHVLSRGFVDAAGNNARSTQGDVMNYRITGSRAYAANKPANAPLYYEGNCASTLKFYSASSYRNNTNDGSEYLAAANYAFLDLNSARPTGHTQNPNGPQSDTQQNPTYTTVAVTNESITFATYCFPYNTVSDTVGPIAGYEPWLYDSFTVTRAIPELSDWTEYDNAVSEAENFMSGDFSIYTDESVTDAIEIVAGALAENALNFSYYENQSVIDNAADAIRSAILEAKDALAVRFIGATPAASVNKMSGNQNELTITVTELYADGSENAITTTLKISNNAAGTYEVGKYDVYVDTKGNDQIRDCYIVD